MTITVNGRYQFQRVTGVQRYAREVMARCASAANVVAPGRSMRGVTAHLWEQSVLPARVGHDLLWSPCNTGPLAVANQVATIHDCAFFDQPGEFSRNFAAWYQWLIPRLARRIRRIITVSQFSRERILRHCRVREEKVVVIPQGVDERFRPLPAGVIAATRERLKLPERYILSVGSLAPRKNLPRLLQAWKPISEAHPDLSLVLVGGGDRIFRGMALGEIPPSVVSAGYLADEDLPAVYGGATLFVFPSLYEGFGLPVLEAMACGVPVLTSNVTSLPEVAGDAALLVDPHSVTSIIDGLHQGLSDPALLCSLGERGRERAKAFTWQATADATWGTLRDARSR